MDQLQRIGAVLAAIMLPKQRPALLHQFPVILHLLLLLDLRQSNVGIKQQGGCAVQVHLHAI
ncbi:hypothetical protein D3C75_684990 [compost metagenome]